MPKTIEEHNRAYQNQSVSMLVKAKDSFSGSENELIIEPSKNNTIVEFSSKTKSYSVVHQNYENFKILIKVDTTDDKDATTAYFAEKEITFSILPQAATVISTAVKLSINEGEPMVARSQSHESKVLVKIPGNGLQGEYIPESIDVEISEYENIESSSIFGKVVEIELSDETGKKLGLKEDINNPLKQVEITLDYTYPVTKSGLQNGLYQIAFADSFYELLQNIDNQVSLNRISHIDESTVTFSIDHLSAFGFIQSDSAEPEVICCDQPRCFIDSVLFYGENTAIIFYIIFSLLIVLAVFVLKYRSVLNKRKS
ncbi:MAG: hypothetical protein OMM_10915 [Candidatus Magnetoglobus multicellularis str. Araruama]|uniref:Uncharacterized protein n=1 Tax=Candidatus Magnetoglobus multicellularis str. Araruama TaxID=890399 RepID=A0A1V1NZQ8_9BACT|nr:MAG: hypothetical protein OMM_10915 [Candidatus Magnetoglobus multicellularis str. Araruama]